jgi:hypothetical protein
LLKKEVIADEKEAREHRRWVSSRCEQDGTLPAPFQRAERRAPP